MDNFSPDDLRGVALRALADVAKDASAPAAARVAAANGLLNAVGGGPGPRGSGGPAPDLSLDEIERELARFSGPSDPRPA